MSQKDQEKTCEVPPEIEMHIDSFLGQLSNAGRAEKTIQAYHQDLKIFFEWLLSHYPSIRSIHDITRPQIHHFFGYLDRTRGNSYSTRKRRISSLGLFFETLVHDRVLDAQENPFPDFKQHPIKQKNLSKDQPVVYLEYEEMLTFMNSVFKRDDKKGGRKDWMKARDICLFDLLLSTGLRISELCSLTVENGHDVIVKNLLGVVGKGNKYRPIPISKETHLERLRDYLNKRPAEAETDALFLTKSLKPMQPRDIQYLIKTYSKRSNIHKNITPHKLRHTFASLLIKNDVDIRKIQLLLGHASISTTQIYTHINIQDQRDAIDKLPEW
ncbi:MAG: tyrosine-type recombinase/integrase [Bacillaceae bacterium]|nr:tyrosine-type recombinase/integrase [Bacillaceae bacterium]